MASLRPTIRFFLTASLMLSLSVVGVYPQLMAGYSGAAVVKADQLSTVCCCGAKDGRCCGMACCQRGMPKPDRTPAPPNPSDDHSQPLALAGIDAAVAGSDSAASEGVTPVRAASAGSVSLVDSRVRLNI
jgi:hypothetical protein